MSPLLVRELLAQKGESLQLESLTGEVGLDRTIAVPEISSPGLVLAGFTSRWPRSTKSSTHSLLPIPDRPMNSSPTPYTSANDPCMVVEGANTSVR